MLSVCKWINPRKTPDEIYSNRNAVNRVFFLVVHESPGVHGLQKLQAPVTRSCELKRLGYRNVFLKNWSGLIEDICLLDSFCCLCFETGSPAAMLAQRPLYSQE